MRSLLESLKTQAIVSLHGENHQQAGSAAVISSNDKHTSTRGVVPLHISYTCTYIQTARLLASQYQILMSVNKRQLGALLLAMLCVFMVASIDCAILHQIKR